MPGLAVIIVSWNTRELLHRCIETLHASLAGSVVSYELVVVDNASSDGTPAMLRAEYPEVRLLEAGRNLGFAGGNNLALRRLLGEVGDTRGNTGDRRHKTRDTRGNTGDRRQETASLGDQAQNSELRAQNSELDYVLLLNPDTEVLGDAIPRLVAYLEGHPDVAVVGPQLRYPDGTVQPSRRRFPTRGTYFFESTPLETRWPNNPWARRYRLADRPDGAEQEVGWLVGAALLVRREAIERAGLLDDGFAMYSEELEWQRRIKRSAISDQRLEVTNLQSPIPNLQPHRIVYLPSAVIVHHEGKSSEQALARRYVNFHRSRLREARMAYGSRFAAALRVFLLGAYAAELALEAGKWLLGHKRPLRAARARVYGELLRTLADEA